MSHIDSFKHQLVGFFGRIRVYKALENINGDFQCKENDLILGGGSGEHPAMVLKNPFAAVAWFLDSEVDDLEMNDSEREQFKSSFQNFINWEPDEIIQFYEWGMSTCDDFYKLCKEGVCLSNRYTQEDISIEEWLILGFGEFVFFAMPELIPEIITELRDPYKHFHHMSYNNILLQPPNIPVYANGGNAYVSTLKKIT